MRHFLKTLVSGAALALGLAEPAAATEFEVRSGFDVLWRNQTAITGMHSLSIVKDLGGGLHFGQALYSAADGDGGGLFIGGTEVFQRLHLGQNLSLDLGGFVGGGGGASVVSGDGLMLKAQATLNYAFGSGWMASLGGGYTRVTGSAIDTPHISFGFSRVFDFALDRGHHPNAHASGIMISAAKGVLGYYHPFNSTRRGGGGTMNGMYMGGAEVTFRPADEDRYEIFMSTVGAIGGDGAGYAEWLIGPRFFTKPLAGTGIRAFADIGVGFAGGGRVDTGGGLVGQVSAGLDIPLFSGLHAEVGALGIGAAQGDFLAAGGFLRVAYRFDDPRANRFGVDGGPTRHWQFTTGVSMHLDHVGLRPPGHPFAGNSPVLVESSLDLYFGKNFYVSGAAHTVVDGMAGGFAMGTIALGWDQPLTDRWSVSAEAFVGAAAGGGIATGGGIIGGVRGEIDYEIMEGLKLSVGAGKWMSRGTARPWTVTAGFKIPFTTYHGR